MDSSSVAAAYDLFADLYDGYVGNFRDDMPFWEWAVEARASVLEIGCGTGRVMTALARQQRTITGVDISTEMLSVAERRLAAAISAGCATLLNHDFASASLPQRFDAAIVTFYTFNHVTEDADVFLGNVFDSLVPGGVIAMDLFCPLPIQKPQLNGVKRTKSATYNGQRIELADTRVMQGRVELRIQVYHLPSGDRTITTRRRYYLPAEMDGLLSAVGFVDHRFAAGYDHTSLNGLSGLPRTDSNFIVTGRKP